MTRLFRVLGSARRYPVTVGIAALTVLFFALEHGFGGGTDLRAHLRLGALRPDRISDHHEYYRLVMPMVLHHGWVHLLLNGMAFLQLGALVEHIWGGRRLALFYVVCGIAGTLASAAFTPTAYAGSVGASGAIMGLAGLVLGASWYGEEGLRSWLMTVVGRRLLNGVLLTFALGIGLWLILPIVDNWGHAGGFAMGLLLALAHPDPSEGEPASHNFGASLAAGIALISIGAVAVDGGRVLQTVEIDTARTLLLRSSRQPGAWTNVPILLEMLTWYDDAERREEGLEAFERGVAQFDEPEPLTLLVVSLLTDLDAGVDRDVHAERALERWMQLEPDDPSALNSMAWHLVTRPDTSRRDPVRAEALSRRSIERIPDPSSDTGRQWRAAFLDTLGEVLYQRARFDEALEVQRESVRLSEELELDDIEEILTRLHKIEAAAG